MFLFIFFLSVSSNNTAAEVSRKDDSVHWRESVWVYLFFFLYFRNFVSLMRHFLALHFYRQSLSCSTTYYYYCYYYLIQVNIDKKWWKILKQLAATASPIRNKMSCNTSTTTNSIVQYRLHNNRVTYSPSVPLLIDNLGDFFFKLNRSATK